MTVKEINDSLIAAMETLASKLDKDVTNTLTIQCTVTATVDAEKGEYTVEYLGNRFTAVTTDRSIHYTKNDNVFVVIPNGDFSSTKMIIGYPTNTYSRAESAETEVIVGNDLLFFSKEQINLSSFKEEQSRPIIFTSDFYKLTLPKYQTDGYKKFRLSYKLKVDPIVENRNDIKNSYGIKLRIPFINTGGNPDFLEAVLGMENDKGVSTLIGDPYDLPVWVKQTVDVVIPAGASIVPENIQAAAFIYGFDSIVDNGNDIHIKDISLCAIKQFTSSNLSGYNLFLNSDNGRFFREKDIEKTIISAELRNKGVPVLLTTLPIYWFVQDPTISETSGDAYHSIGGEGWRFLKRGGEYLDIDIKDVSYQRMYKCVVIYDSETITSTILIENLGSNIIQISSTNGSNIVLRDIGIAELQCNISPNDNSATYVWGIYNTSGEFLGQAGNTKISKVASSRLESRTVFNCSVYKNSILYACGFYTISLADGSGYKLQIENGNVNIRYDSNGRCPRDSKYVGSEKYALKPLDYTIYRADGIKLNESEYSQVKAYWKVPTTETSMLKFIIPNGLEYKITTEEIIEVDDNGTEHVEKRTFYEFVYTGHEEQVRYNFADKKIHNDETGKDTTVYELYDSARRNGTVYLTVKFGNVTLYDSTQIRVTKEGAQNITYRDGEEVFSFSETDGSIVIGKKTEGQIIYSGAGNSIAGINIVPKGLSTSGWELDNNGTIIIKSGKDSFKIQPTLTTIPLITVNKTTGVLTYAGSDISVITGIKIE